MKKSSIRLLLVAIVSLCCSIAASQAQDLVTVIGGSSFTNNEVNTSSVGGSLSDKNYFGSSDWLDPNFVGQLSLFDSATSFNDPFFSNSPNFAVFGQDDIALEITGPNYSQAYSRSQFRFTVDEEVNFTLSGSVNAAGTVDNSINSGASLTSQLYFSLSNTSGGGSLNYNNSLGWPFSDFASFNGTLAAGTYQLSTTIGLWGQGNANAAGNFQLALAAVPETSVLLILGAAFIGILAKRSRRPALLTS